MNLLVSVFIFLFAHSILFCQAPSISGTVKNYRGEAIIGAEVTLLNESRTTVTDSSGQFRFDSLYLTDYCVQISAPGYEEYSTCVPLKIYKQYKDDHIVLRKNHPVKKSINAWVLSTTLDQYIMRVAIHQGWRTMGEVSFGLCDYYHKSAKFFPDYWLDDVVIGAEYNFGFQKPLLGPKIAYHQTRSMIGFGVESVYYTDFDLGTIYLKPLAGFSWDATWNFWFGYNIPLMTNHMRSRVNRFTVTFSIAINSTSDYDEKTRIWRGREPRR